MKKVKKCYWYNYHHYLQKPYCFLHNECKGLCKDFELNIPDVIKSVCERHEPLEEDLPFPHCKKCGEII